MVRYFEIDTAIQGRELVTRDGSTVRRFFKYKNSDTCSYSILVNAQRDLWRKVKCDLEGIAVDGNASDDLFIF